MHYCNGHVQTVFERNCVINSFKLDLGLRIRIQIPKSLFRHQYNDIKTEM